MQILLTLMESEHLAFFYPTSFLPHPLSFSLAHTSLPPSAKIILSQFLIKYKFSIIVYINPTMKPLFTAEPYGKLWLYFIFYLTVG